MHSNKKRKTFFVISIVLQKNSANMQYIIGICNEKTDKRRSNLNQTIVDFFYYFLDMLNAGVC